MKTTHLFNKAFTIIELMIVVVVIGILVGVATLGYGNWQNSIAKKAVQSDLKMAASAMDNAKNFKEGYPTSIPTTFKSGSNVTITYYSGNLTTFCIDGKYTSKPIIRYYIDTTKGKDPRFGTCATGDENENAPGAPGAPSPSASATSSSSITVTWSAVSGATSYIVRYGTSSPTTTASCSSSPCTLSGLSASTLYYVGVAASNQNGASAQGTAQATTQAAGSAPATPSPSASATSSSSITVTWSAVSGATSYIVRYGTSSPTTTASCSSSPCTLSGLSASTLYYVGVRASNQFGTSAQGTAQATTQAAGGGGGSLQGGPLFAGGSGTANFSTITSLTMSWPSYTWSGSGYSSCPAGSTVKYLYGYNTAGSGSNYSYGTGNSASYTLGNPDSNPNNSVSYTSVAVFCADGSNNKTSNGQLIQASTCSTTYCRNNGNGPSFTMQ